MLKQNITMVGDDGMVYNDYFEWGWAITKIKLPLYFIFFLSIIIMLIVRHITENDIIAMVSFGIFAIGGFIFILMIVTIIKRRNYF